MTRRRNCSPKAAGSCAPPPPGAAVRRNRRPRTSGCVSPRLSAVGYCGFSDANRLSVRCRELLNVSEYDPPNCGISPLNCGPAFHSVVVSLPDRRPAQHRSHRCHRARAIGAHSENRVVHAFRRLHAIARLLARQSAETRSSGSLASTRSTASRSVRRFSACTPTRGRTVPPASGRTAIPGCVCPKAEPASVTATATAFLNRERTPGPRAAKPFAQVLP